MKPLNLHKYKMIKKTFFWKYLIQYFFYPIYNIFWEYILNFNAKLLFLLWKTKDNHFKLQNNDFIIIDEDQQFKILAKKILSECIPLMEDSKKTIISKEYKNKMSLLVGEKGSDAEIPYRISLYEHLSKNLKKEIINLASSDRMITTAAKYMGIFPILTRVQVYHNIPRSNSNIRGAMNWHKDTFGFKNLDFFMNITDVDDENGPFYFLKKKITGSTFMNFSNKISTTNKGERGKVNIDEFSKHFNDNDTAVLKGDSGNAIFLDSFSTFHRGGFCKNKDRVALRFCYQSHDTLYENQVVNNHFKYYEEIKSDNTNNKFKKYLFLKEKNKVMIFLAPKLAALYRKVDFNI